MHEQTGIRVNQSMAHPASKVMAQEVVALHTGNANLVLDMDANAFTLPNPNAPHLSNNMRSKSHIRKEKEGAAHHQAA